MSNPIDENDTRHRLIDAALHLFGRKGFDGTSTRELAARAGTNIASIAYHFGGKSGLREACARAVEDRVSGVLDAQGIALELATPEAALEQIERLVRAIVQLIVAAPQARDMVTFMLRELTDPGEVTETIYAEFIDPRHRALCDLWATATGRAAEDDEIKLTVFATVGQILYFRIAQPFVGQRMAWDRIGQNETRKITDIVVANVRDSIERLRI